MLKQMNRSEVKEVIILLVFTGLLGEILTKPTMVLVVLGALMVWLRLKFSALVRNILTLGIFFSYWMIYGKVIDPEIGLNFLTSIIVLKLLEKQTLRDQFMIFMGLILLISAGSLFQKNILYVAFFILSFFILIQEFYKGQSISNRFQQIGQSLIWVLPLSVLLFFFAPRMVNPFQIEKGGPKDGEVGYTPDVNLSNIESVSYNDRLVFQATIDSELSNKELYWRGNTLSFSDGWNWPLMPQNRPIKEFKSSQEKTPSRWIRQLIRASSQQEFFFGLDRPLAFIGPKGMAHVGPSYSLSQIRGRPVSKYTVFSEGGESLAQNSEPSSSNMRSSLSPMELNWIHEHFKSDNLTDLKREIQNYFLREKFSYSLSPGRVRNFLEFMKEKKIGFCSHYASALAQILRAKKINSRLVSGFLGGSYNRFAGYYNVSQNDAHVWVEAIHEGHWVRLDPTEWIAPERVQLGGEAFMQQSLEGGQLGAMRRFRRNFSFLNDIEQWMGQWDFKFNLWLDEMDYYGQEALFARFHFKREWIFSIVPVLLALFIGLYTWQLSRRNTSQGEIEELWAQFRLKLNKHGEQVPFLSLAEIDKVVADRDERLQALWKELVRVTFQESETGPLKELKNKIKRL